LNRDALKMVTTYHNQKFEMNPEQITNFAAELYELIALKTIVLPKNKSDVAI